jgi:hypothetical protein
MAFEVIGISGKARCGKDYISTNFLFPLGYKSFSLAWHFKVWLVAKGEATYEEVFFTKPPHVRKLLQEEGTERGRVPFGENIWCDTAATWMRVMSEHMGINKFVIPDVRFPNEVEMVQRLGGKVMRITAPEREKKSDLTWEARQHISETALDNFLGFDGIVYNDPKYSESVRRQVMAILGEQTICDEDPEDETLFDKIKDFVTFPFSR